MMGLRNVISLSLSLSIYIYIYKDCFMWQVKSFKSAILIRSCIFLYSFQIIEGHLFIIFTRL